MKKLMMYKQYFDVIDFMLKSFIIKKGLVEGILIKASPSRFGKKSFVPTPRNATTGKVDFASVPQGMSIWITIHGKHIPITRLGDNFQVDMQASKGSGYIPTASEKKLAHLSFSLADVEERQQAKTEKTKQTTPEQRQRKQAVGKIKRKHSQIKNKALKDLMNFVGDDNDKQEMSDLKAQIKEKIKDFGLDKKAEDIYVNQVLKVVEGKLKADRFNEAKKIVDGEDASGQIISEMNLIRPSTTTDEYQMIGEIRAGFDEDGDNKISFDTSIKADKKKALQKDSTELTDKMQAYEDATAELGALKRELPRAGKERLKQILKIGKTAIRVSPKDIEMAKNNMERNLNLTTTESMYTMLSDYWDGETASQLNHIKERASIMQLEGMMNKYLDMDIELSKGMQSLPASQVVRLVAGYLKSEYTPEEYGKVRDGIEKWFMDNMEDIENSAINRVKTLREQMDKMKTSETSYDLKTEKLLAENLIEQRNVLSGAWGVLNSTSEFLNVLDNMPEVVDEIEIELNGKDGEKQYNDFALAVHKQKSGKLVVFKPALGLGKPKMLIRNPAETMKSYFKKRQIDKKHIEELNKLKYNEEDTKGWNIKANINGKYQNFFKDRIVKPDGNSFDFKARKGQRNDAEFILANGGNGIIARAVASGKTMTIASVHGMQLQKDPQHCTFMCVPLDNVEQQREEYEAFTNANVIQVPEFSSHASARAWATANSKKLEGGLVVISHDNMKKYPKILGHHCDTFAGDEFHKVILNKRGDMKGAGKDIRTGIRHANKIMVTATPYSDNPADMFNALDMVVPKRSLYRKDVGKARREQILGYIAQHDKKGLEINEDKFRKFLTGIGIDEGAKRNPTADAMVNSYVHKIPEKQFMSKKDFRMNFGDREKLSVDGHREISNFSVADISLGKDNLVQNHFKELTDQFVTSDKEVTREDKDMGLSYKASVTNDMISVSPELSAEVGKYIESRTTGKAEKGKSEREYFTHVAPSKLKEIFGIKKENGKEVPARTPTAKERSEFPMTSKQMEDYKKNNPDGIWNNKKLKTAISNNRDNYIDKITKEKQKLMDSWDGVKNPKTAKMSGRVIGNPQTKHLVFVNDKAHENHIRDVLKKQGYPVDKMFSRIIPKNIKDKNTGKRVDSKPRKAEIKSEWEKVGGDYGGILFVNEGDAEGTNFQSADMSHNLNSVELASGSRKEQLEGRIMRLPRTGKKAEVFHYHFDTVEDRYAITQHGNYINRMGMMDESKYHDNITRTTENSN